MVIGYHATNSAAAARIASCGFRCGSKGLAGGAIYFATSEADARRKSNNGDDVVLCCELTMGRVCELDHNGCPSMTLQKLKQMGYDSVKIRRSGDEYAVYEPSRVRILVDSDDDVDEVAERINALANELLRQVESLSVHLSERFEREGFIDGEELDRLKAGVKALDRQFNTLRRQAGI
jgi:hypothetical protein